MVYISTHYSCQPQVHCLQKLLGYLHHLSVTTIYNLESNIAHRDDLYHTKEDHVHATVMYLTTMCVELDFFLLNVAILLYREWSVVAFQFES